LASSGRPVILNQAQVQHLVTVRAREHRQLCRSPCRTR
jgi:hypothetical protein